MARGKGEVKGWITRNGVHIPIYDNYSVRGGVEPKAKGSKFKGAGKKRKKPEFNTGKGDYGDYVNAKTVSGLEEGLKSKGLTLDSADRHYMETARPGDEDKITVWDKDGNKYTGTFNKYSDGGVELVNMKKSAKKTPSMTAESSKDDLVNRINAKTAEKLAEHDTRRAEEETKQRASDHTEEGLTRSKAVNDYLSNKDGRREAFNKELNERYGEQAEESSKVDRKQDAIDYIAKREDVHPSVAKDTYEHMSESERNHVANEAFKSRTSSTPNTLANRNALKRQVEGKKSDNWNVDHVKNDILPSNTSDKEKSDYINFLHNKGKINDSEKAELMNELGSKSATTQQDRPKNFKEGLKQHEGIQKIANDQNEKVWNGGASNQELYDAADKFAEEKNFNKGKVRDAAFSAFNEKWVATQKERAGHESSTISAEDHKQATNYLKSNLKAALPTSVSGLKQAYADATGEEKSAIRAELRKKGYTYVGGKWVKGK